jgi:O-antigen/teichoic acid export membrane protein
LKLASNTSERVRTPAPFRRIARGGAAAFGIHAVGVGLTYFSQLLVARVVGPNSYGNYFYALSWITVLSYFSALGFDVALLRYAPAYQTQRAWPLLRGVIQYAESRATYLGILVVVAGTVVMMVSKHTSLELRNTFLVGLMLTPIWALLWIRCALVRAFGGVVSALAPDRLVRDGVLLGLIALTSVGFNWRVDAPMVMTFTFVGSVIGLTVASTALSRMRPHEIIGVAPKYDASAWRQTALPLVIMAVTEILMNRMGVLFLGWMGQTKAAGIYGLAFSVALLITLPRMAVNTLFAPTISNLYILHDIGTLNRLVARSTLWTLMGAACIGFGLVVLANPLLSWFGKDYGAGVPALFILIAGQLIVASTGSQMFLMTMTGDERRAAFLLVFSCAANALFSVILIPWFGLVGAAVGSTLALVLWNAAMALFIWWRLGLLPGVFAGLRSPNEAELRVEKKTGDLAPIRPLGVPVGKPTH